MASYFIRMRSSRHVKYDEVVVFHDLFVGLLDNLGTPWYAISAYASKVSKIKTATVD